MTDNLPPDVQRLLDTAPLISPLPPPTLETLLAHSEFADRLPTDDVRVCEHGCGCRYGTDDADRRDCGCYGPCCYASPDEWGCDPDLGGCGHDCPTCPKEFA